MSLPCEHPTHPFPPPWTPGVQTRGTKRGLEFWVVLEEDNGDLDSWVLSVDGLENRYCLGPGC